MRWSRGRNCSVWSSTEQWSRGIMTFPRLLQDIIIIIIISLQSDCCKSGEDAGSSRETVQHQMWRDGWEGEQLLFLLLSLLLLLLLMVEKVNNCYYHCYYHWWLRRWDITVNIIFWREHKNSWITNIHSQSEPQDDIAHVELKSVSGGATIFTKSIFVRFNDLDLRWNTLFLYLFNYLFLGWKSGQIKATQRRTR